MVVRYAPEDPTLPPPWRGLIDEETGYLYFWNTETNETSYQRPAPAPPVPPAMFRPPVNAVAQYAYNGALANGQHNGPMYPSTVQDPNFHTPQQQVPNGVLGAAPHGVSHAAPSNYNRTPEALDYTNHDSYNHPQAQIQLPQTQVEVPSPLSPAEVEAYKRQHEITVLGNDVPPPMVSFSATGLPPQVLAEIQAAGFSSPTPIQAQSWPIALNGRDIVAIAKTGSGKTLGYLLPAFLHLERQRNDPRFGPTVLVLCPTRELATQIESEARKFGSSSNITSMCIYGGTPKAPQLAALSKGCDIIIACPGRLNDFLEMRKINLNQVSYLVLDEADRMLDMGFEPQIRKIVSFVPTQRQTLMYTATWPREVREIAGMLLTNPVQVNIGADDLVANNAITQFVEVVTEDEKFGRLLHVLRNQERWAKIIIFCSKKKLCDHLAFQLRNEFRATVIHGDKSQSERDWVLAKFKSGEFPILVATDVAARGLDIKDIRVVINYDFPTNVEDYVHRIGRTGRAGATGLAHTFFLESDGRHARKFIDLLERTSQPIPTRLRELACMSYGKGRPKYGVPGLGMPASFVFSQARLAAPVNQSRFAPSNPNMPANVNGNIMNAPIDMGILGSSMGRTGMGSMSRMDMGNRADMGSMDRTELGRGFENGDTHRSRYLEKSNRNRSSSRSRSRSPSRVRNYDRARPRSRSPARSRFTDAPPSDAPSNAYEWAKP